MKNTRLLASTVFCVSVLALSACGGDSDTAETAAPAPSAAATTGAPATASAAPAAAAASDKDICQSAVKATTAFGEKLAESLKAGQEFGDAEIKAAWTAMATELKVAEGGTSDVAKAAQSVQAELTKAAAATDVAAAEESPSYQKAVTDLETACKAEGVDLNAS
ncbi:hypothetical protein [Catenuloplanes indicus]|uniref:Outer membrane receptor protein involved in Fe transport n=1 Tax=Catenuloplanes indicus TaxID=137267 RepID=A0AAE3VUA9_9ACTN|nr:hypothetical protein [Catenuloplanes indicus]MDQ0363966.1 outer membrane receptor protein involved in Fe transport [Catenuloplanes indicus]